MANDDDFAICPRNGYPRLFRFDINDDRILSELDKEKNLLRINQYLFDQLPRHQQEEVFRTKARMLTLDNFD